MFSPRCTRKVSDVRCTCVAVAIAVLVFAAGGSYTPMICQLYMNYCVQILVQCRTWAVRHKTEPVARSVCFNCAENISSDLFNFLIQVFVCPKEFLDDNGLWTRTWWQQNAKCWMLILVVIRHKYFWANPFVADCEQNLWSTYRTFICKYICWLWVFRFIVEILVSWNGAKFNDTLAISAWCVY